MSDRPFRRPESHLAEQITRRMLPGFLQSRGFRIEEDLRVRHGQTLEGHSPDGQRVSMRIKLCWRRGEEGRDAGRLVKYSAVQLMARITDGRWEESIHEKVAREESHGVTHYLFVQRDGSTITLAALVPLAAVLPIWTEQRDVSTRLIREGRLGRRKKNHAMNGASPTIWLQDDRGGQPVAAVIWKHGAVLNVVQLPVVSEAPLIPEEVFDAKHYMEGATDRVTVNAYERDERARWKCIEHYGTSCFICGFNFGAVYGSEADGHIHVHHLRPLPTLDGAYEVDPIADLRPVCPNCHAAVHLNGGCRPIEEVQSMLERARSQPQMP
jgi:5-methylcytosine-specific restriction enzyme A